MKIKDITNQYHISRKALLIYEEKGLIHPSRDMSGYREYNDQDIAKIKKIILLRKFDFSLDEIENIVLNKQYDRLYKKKDEYDKETHFIETKKLYLDYLYDVITDEQDSDEAIEAAEQTLKLYAHNNYDDMIHFEYHKDTIIMLWIACLLISILSGQIWLVGVAIVVGIMAFIISLKIVRKFCLRFPMKKIIGCILIIMGVIALIVCLPQQDTFPVCLGSAFGIYSISYGIVCFSKIREFLNKHLTIFTFFSLLIGMMLFGIGCYYSIEGALGFTLMLTAVLFIGLGIIFNKYIRYIFFEILFY